MLHRSYGPNVYAEQLTEMSVEPLKVHKHSLDKYAEGFETSLEDQETFTCVPAELVNMTAVPPLPEVEIEVAEPNMCCCGWECGCDTVVGADRLNGKLCRFKLWVEPIK